jgi:endoglucanase
MKETRLPRASKARTRAVLKRVLPQPTAPYHEYYVRDALSDFLSGLGLKPRLDASGNLIVSYKRGAAAPITWLAHMDHPGFEILSVRADGTTADARWNGQVPTFDLRGKRLALFSDDPAVGRRGTAVVLAGDGRGPRDKVWKIKLRVPRGTRAGDFGHANLPGLVFRGGRIVSKALDNVGGCCAIAATLEHLVRFKLPGDVRVVFTRAEEEGFKGAFAAIRDGSALKSRPIVVLECSKAMPGAEMGKGPVIRVGDRLRVFDPDTVLACETAAARRAAQNPNFRYQRRLMDGGACEASAFSLAGYRTVCLAFPLGNYHNIGKSSLLSEYIDESDFHNGVEALAAFAAYGVSPDAVRRRVAKRLDSRFTRTDAARLRRTVHR